MTRLSVILPFYKKAGLFRAALSKNSLYHQDEVEVVCVLDAPEDERPALQIVRDNPQIKFRVIVNDEEHPWRPPCKAYNVGIRHALADQVLLTDPESIVVLENSIDYWTNYASYSGVTWMCPGEARVEDEYTVPPWTWTLGALLCPKRDLILIGGYDETRTTYGFDDTDLRNRLVRNGCAIVVTGRMKIFHPEHSQELNRQHGIEPCGTKIVMVDQLHNFGTAFGRVAYDWKE